MITDVVLLENLTDVTVLLLVSLTVEKLVKQAANVYENNWLCTCLRPFMANSGSGNEVFAP